MPCIVPALTSTQACCLLAAFGNWLLKQHAEEARGVYSLMLRPYWLTAEIAG